MAHGTRGLIDCYENDRTQQSDPDVVFDAEEWLASLLPPAYFADQVFFLTPVSTPGVDTGGSRAGTGPVVSRSEPETNMESCPEQNHVLL